MKSGIYTTALLLFLLIVNTQKMFSNVSVHLTITDSLIVYNKTTDFDHQRTFKNDLNSKYSGKDFTYIDDLKEPKEKTLDNTDFSGLTQLLMFLAKLLPYFLGIVVVYIIVRSFVDVDSNFWRFKKSKKPAIELLVENEEDIADNDFSQLLALAIKNKDYRLSTRYYYLLLLQKLAEKKHISYDIDKTNADYLLELKEDKMQKQFSFLSYIFNYVWYGKFPVDETKFNTIQQNYKAFINSIN